MSRRIESESDLTNFGTWALDNSDRLFEIRKKNDDPDTDCYYGFISEAVELPDGDILLGFIGEDDDETIRYYKLSEISLIYNPENGIKYSERDDYDDE